MIRTVGRAIALCALLGAGCATVHPNFEQTFRGGRPSRDQWMILLTSRYGCDTAIVVANMPRRWEGVGLPSLTREPVRRMQVGMTACDVASVIAPEVVDAWVTPQGIREEWKYRPGQGGLTSVYLEGHETNALQVVPPLPAPARR
jgi:hypothetical protein